VLVDAELFLGDLRREFPDLGAYLDDEANRGLFYVQVGTFASYVQRLIDGGMRAEVQHCFAVADLAIREGDGEVQNAIGVAFLEHLNFQDGKVRRGWAFGLLPANLKSAAASLGIAEGYRQP
jgi:hypothetical protein